jgi:hypothetical protein
MKTAKRRTNRKKHGRKGKTHKNKKFVTAIESAESNYKKTGNLMKARLAFRAQALANARTLFGTSKYNPNK